MSSEPTRYPLAFILLLAALMGHAAVQTDCAKIESDRDRLECYDRLNSQPDGKVSQSPWDLALQADASVASPLNERWELDTPLDKFVFRPYKPVYFFPVFYQDTLNRQPQTPNPRTTVNTPLTLDNIEAKFQLSFKTKLGDDLISGNGDLWLGYTQTSRWQLYNEAESRPFRETNHEPEFILAWRTRYPLLGFTGRLFSLSLNHQSNGQDEPLSRSWNRLIVTIGLDRPDWAVLIRPWWRIPETSDEEDENPAIVDYVGRAELLLVHRRGNTHQISTQIRHSLRDGVNARGSLNLNWSYPCFQRLRCHAQLFHGYGESLIDYNHRTTAIGLGVKLLDWF